MYNTLLLTQIPDVFGVSQPHLGGTLGTLLLTHCFWNLLAAHSKEITVVRIGLILETLVQTFVMIGKNKKRKISSPQHP